MYTLIDYEVKRVETRTYKQLTDESLDRIIKDLKKYCDDELLIISDRTKLGFSLVPESLIRKIITIQNPDNKYVNTDYIVFKRNSKGGHKLKTVWNTRWENDDKGYTEVWTDYLEDVINTFISKHKNNYNWKTINVIKTEYED